MTSVPFVPWHVQEWDDRRDGCDVHEAVSAAEPVAAVGTTALTLDARLEIVADWTDEHPEGVVYYLHEGRVRGVLL